MLHLVADMCLMQSILLLVICSYAHMQPLAVVPVVATQGSVGLVFVRARVV
jgi:hypothetical protein